MKYMSAKENNYREVNTNFFKTLKAYDYDKIEKFNKGEYFKDNDNPQNDEVINFIADFTTVDMDLLWSQSVTTIKDLFINLMNNFSNYIAAEPIKEIKINRVVYTFRTEYLKMSVGWWEHVKSIVNKSETEQVNPIDILGLVYIEKGKDYAQLDKNKNVINPTSERTKILAEHLTLKEFIDVNNFFLTILQMHKSLSQESKEMLSKKMTKKELKNLMGLINLN